MVHDLNPKNLQIQGLNYQLAIRNSRVNFKV